MLWAFKLHGCADCGTRHPDIALADLHCHHRDPATKVIRDNKGLLQGGNLRTLNANQDLLDELAKCDVVCVECHRKRHKARLASYEQQALFNGTGEAWIIP